MSTSIQQPIAFLSYARRDDEHDAGRITAIRKQLQSEVEVLTGKRFQIFQDQENISVGQPWRTQIQLSIDNTSLLIAMVTPSFLNSPMCCDEVHRFVRRENELAREDLIIPIIYVPTPTLDDTDDDVVRILRERQFDDWTELRFEELSSQIMRRKIHQLAGGIVAALQRGVAVATNSISKSIVVDNEQPGFIELLADAEETMPLLHRTMTAWGAELNIYSDILNRATAQLQAANQPGRPAAARITVMHQLKGELEAPVSRMEVLADEYVEQLAIVGAGMGALISRVSEIDGPEEVDAVKGMFNSLDELASTADGSVASTITFRESVETQYALSSTLRPILRRLAQALARFEPTAGEYARWRDDLKLALEVHETG